MTRMRQPTVSSMYVRPTAGNRCCARPCRAAVVRNQPRVGVCTMHAHVLCATAMQGARTTVQQPAGTATYRPLRRGFCEVIGAVQQLHPLGAFFHLGTVLASIHGCWHYSERTQLRAARQAHARLHAGVVVADDEHVWRVTCRRRLESLVPRHGRERVVGPQVGWGRTQGCGKRKSPAEATCCPPPARRPRKHENVNKHQAFAGQVPLAACVVLVEGAHV